jgi:predicted deacetylase
MMAQYLLRFDDLCPTMNHARWSAFQQIAENYGIKPILAIVPDNRDAKLTVAEEDPAFWQRMRRAQDRGWTIALHGYQHQCVTQGRSLVPIHDRSEFAGLAPQAQQEKLATAVGILRTHGLDPSVWVAPRHGFDRATLQALKAVGITCISDGFHLYPYLADGMFWIPQQVWSPHAKRLGIWTICIHSNTASDSLLAQTAQFVRAHQREFTSVPELSALYGRSPDGWTNRVFRRWWHARLRLRSLGISAARRVQEAEC